MTTAVRARKCTLGDALAAFENWRLREADYSHKTWAGEKPGLLAFTDFMHELGVDHVHEITEDYASAWFAGIKARLSPATVPTRLHQLRTFLRYCERQQWLVQDPTRFLRAVRPAPEQRDRLDADELLALLDGSGPRDRILLALAANLALRGGEIRRLRVKDVDFEDGVILVRVDKTNENDAMPIGPDLEHELREWLFLYRAACPQVTPESYLVPAQYLSTINAVATYRPHRPIGEPYETVKRALERIGWEHTKQEGVHTLRRSVARLFFDMIEEEETYDSALLATMSLLHHNRPETTLRYIGRDRVVMARDRIMRRPFLTRLSEPATAPTQLRSVK